MVTFDTLNHCLNYHNEDKSYEDIDPAALVDADVCM
jgi:hypothetical protein